MSASSQPHVLLIEDDPRDARLVTEALAGLPPDSAFELEWVDQLQSGLRVIDEKSVDVVLLDLSLPDEQGLSAVKRIHLLVPDLPVVVLGGSQDEGTALQALQLGAQDYILKDEIDGRLLTRSIRYALERARTKRHLRQLSNRLLTVIDASPLGIVAVDMDHRVTVWNPAAEKILGWMESEWWGIPFSLETETSEGNSATVASLVMQGASINHRELPYTTKYGKTIVLNVSAAAFRDEHGRIAGIIYLMDDVTEVKKMREELRRSEERYRDLFENANDIVFTLDTGGKFTSINKKGTDILGYSRDELIGKHIVSVTAPDSIPEVVRTFLAPAADGTSSPREVELRTKDGSIVPLEAGVRTIYRDGRAAGFQAIVRDNRDRKRFEAQLQQVYKMEALGRLAGGVAHDFNNLLTVIAGYAQLLLAKEPNPETSYVLPIITATDRAGSLTRQLLAFSRKQVVQRTVLELGPLIRDFQRMLRRLISENIEIIVNVAPNLGRTKGDPGQIEQVIMNLALNARDAMPKGGKLIIEASNTSIGRDQLSHHLDAEEGEYVMISVTDSGSGMDEKTREHIFEPFFTTKPVGQGTGLGLATVYGIVRQNGGHIWVYSEPKRGTSFKVFFPRVLETIGAPAPSHGAHPLRKGKETILVVEDEKNLRSFVQTVLNGWGYRVLTAANGDEAIDICKQYPDHIDLVLTDMIMPGLTGREVVSQIRNMKKDIRVIYMSGYPGETTSEKAISEQEGLYLQKPFVPAELSERLWQIFGEPKVTG